MTTDARQAAEATDCEAKALELARKLWRSCEFIPGRIVPKEITIILAALQSAYAAGKAEGIASANGWEDQCIAIVNAHAEGDAAGFERGVKAAAGVAGTMAERPYDNEPEFSAVLAVEAAILALIPSQPKEPA